MTAREPGQEKELSPIAIAIALGAGAGVWVLIDLLRQLVS